LSVTTFPREQLSLAGKQISCFDFLRKFNLFPALASVGKQKVYSFQNEHCG